MRSGISTAQQCTPKPGKCSGLPGNGLTLFFWITDEYLKNDPDLNKLPDCYEGFKLHGGETPWLEMPDVLDRVLAIARERNFRVQIHTGEKREISENPISAYLPYCRKYPTVKFDLAHGKPFTEINQAINEADNIYVDCAYSQAEIVQKWLDNGAREDRILFGSDIPVQQRLFDVSLTAYLRNTLKGFSSKKILSQNFKDFMSK